MDDKVKYEFPVKPMHSTVADFRFEEAKIIFECPECDYQRVVYYHEDLAKDNFWKIKRSVVTNDGDRKFNHSGGNGMGGVNMTPPGNNISNPLRDAFGELGEE